MNYQWAIIAILHLLGAVLTYCYVTDWDAWNGRDSENEPMGKVAKWTAAMLWEIVVFSTLLNRRKSK